MQYDMLHTSARDGELRPLIWGMVRTVVRLTRSGSRCQPQFFKRLREPLRHKRNAYVG